MINFIIIFSPSISVIRKTKQNLFFLPKFTIFINFFHDLPHHINWLSVYLNDQLLTILKLIHTSDKETGNISSFLWLCTPSFPLRSLWRIHYRQTANWIRYQVQADLEPLAREQRKPVENPRDQNRVPGSPLFNIITFRWMMGRNRGTKTTNYPMWRIFRFIFIILPCIAISAEQKLVKSPGNMVSLAVIGMHMNWFCGMHGSVLYVKYKSFFGFDPNATNSSALFSRDRNHCTEIGNIIITFPFWNLVCQN